MDIKKLAESLSENEILVLKNLKAKATALELEQLTKLSQVEVIRALQWLDNKGLISLKKEEKEIIELGKYGKEYLQKGLPERNLLKHLLKLKAIRFEDAKKRIGFSEEELQASLGALKKKLLVAIDNGRIILKVSADEANKPMLEEKFIDELPLETNLLTPENKFAFNELKKRKEIIEIKKKNVFSAQLTDSGRKILKNLPREKLVETITPDLLKSDKWKKVKFKRYDVSVRVPEIYGGKRQAYYAFLSDVKKELVRLGFKEMKGPTVESEFWNFDALFQPQFHIARDWSDTYYVNADVDLPNREIINSVKRQHEKSWKYSWDLEKSKRAILRPQGTSISARMLMKAEIPGKYFAIARCYRPDVIDSKHLSEFNQVEGIILDRNITFQNLLGQLNNLHRFLPNQKKLNLFQIITLLQNRVCN